MMGGVLSQDCGYSLVPIETFEEVFAKVEKNSNKKTVWEKLFSKEGE